MVIHTPLKPLQARSHASRWLLFLRPGRIEASFGFALAKALAARGCAIAFHLGVSAWSAAKQHSCPLVVSVHSRRTRQPRRQRRMLTASRAAIGAAVGTATRTGTLLHVFFSFFTETLSLSRSPSLFGSDSLPLSFSLSLAFSLS